MRYKITQDAIIYTSPLPHELLKTNPLEVIPKGSVVSGTKTGSNANINYPYLVELHNQKGRFIDFAKVEPYPSVKKANSVFSAEGDAAGGLSMRSMFTTKNILIGAAVIVAAVFAYRKWGKK